MNEQMRKVIDDLSEGLSEEMKMIIDGLTESLVEEINISLLQEETYKIFDKTFFSTIGQLEESFMNNEKAKELYNSLIMLILQKQEILSVAISKQAFMKGISFCNHIRSTL